MPLKFKDYYEVLGVQRTATADEIRKAYRKLARKYHPDVNKNRDAEDRFKELSEAYDVIGDPAKRKRYDTLGADYRNGQEFTPPPGWAGGRQDFRNRGQGAHGFSPEEMGNFSEFFETLFGGQPGGSGRKRHTNSSPFGDMRGADHEGAIDISLEEAIKGATRTVTLETMAPDNRGRTQRQKRTYKVRIPPGTQEGARIRLSGQGGTSMMDGPAGDLYLRVNILPHPHFRMNNRDIEVIVPVTPWEAVLGARIPVRTLHGEAHIPIPAGTKNGQRFRLKNQGFPETGNNIAGHLYAVVEIAVPEHPTEREKELFKELARDSSFNPRAL